MFKDQFQAYKNRLGRDLVKSGYILKGEMQNIVAIDTGKLRDDIKVFPLETSGSVLKVSVGTDNNSYAPSVEGVEGNTVKQYHRRSGASRPVVWVGVGMQYMARSLNNTQREIINILKSTKT